MVAMRRSPHESVLSSIPIDINPADANTSISLGPYIEAMLGNHTVTPCLSGQIYNSLYHATDDFENVDNAVVSTFIFAALISAEHPLRALTPWADATAPEDRPVPLSQPGVRVEPRRQAFPAALSRSSARASFPLAAPRLSAARQRP